MGSERVSPGVAARLSRYLQILTQARKAGRSVISSQALSGYSGINSTQIRRDLSSFGRFGKRGIGYNVDNLIASIKEILHTPGQHNIAIMGSGNLGSAIAGSDVYAEHGFRIAAIFDVDPARVGENVGRLRVQHVSELKQAVEDHNIIVGVIADPPGAAQDSADALTDAGVRIIFNYSDALVDAPPGTTVHCLSPAGELVYALYSHLA